MLRRFAHVSSVVAVAVAVAGIATGNVAAATGYDVHQSPPAANSAAAGSEFGPQFYGMNDDYDGAAEFSDDGNFIGQLVQLGPGSLRWPGGTGADYFQWRTGKPSNSTLTYNFTLQDLYAQYKATNATPIFDLNVLTEANRTDPSDQIQMLQQAQSLGLPIKYVEIGNELYFDGPSGDFANAFATGTDYGKTVGIYTSALHQAFPGVQVSADGVLHPTNDRESNWNSLMMTAAGQSGVAPDAVTLHDYPGPNIDGFTGTPDQLSSLFEGPYKAISDFNGAADSAALAGKPLWITEYNIATAQHQPNPEQLTYAHELYLAALGMMLPRVNDAALVDNWSAFANGAGLGAWDDPSDPTLTPDGQAVKFVDRAAHLRQASTPITFPGAPTLPNGDPEIIGQAFTSSGQTPHAVIVNLSSSDWQVPVGGDIATGVAYKQVTGTPRDAESAAPTPTTGTVGTTTLDLPAYSVTQIGDCSC